jgi:hypothetical protein
MCPAPLLVILRSAPGAVADALELGEEHELGGLLVLGADVFEGNAHRLLIPEAAEADDQVLVLSHYARLGVAGDGRQSH